MKRKIKGNLYIFEDNFVIGYTSNTNKEFYFDLEDYERVKEYTWREDKFGYIITTAWDKDSKRKYKIFLHRFILKLEGVVSNNFIDHIDRNRKDNRKINLRLTNFNGNNRNINLRKDNKSGIIGVHENKRGWVASLKINGERIILGTRKDKEKAIKLRLMGEIIYYGEFAPQQHLYKTYNLEENKIKNMSLEEIRKETGGR